MAKRSIPGFTAEQKLKIVKEGLLPNVRVADGIVLNFCIYLQVQKNRTRKTMQKVIEIFHKHYGYAYLKDLKAQGVHTDTIRKLLAEGKIEKIKPGLSV